MTGVWPNRLAHMVRFASFGWRCVDCGERFTNWPPDDDRCPGPDGIERSVFDKDEPA